MTREGFQQHRDRRKAEQKKPAIRYHVLIQRIQDGSIVLSEADGYGDTLREALFSARSRTKNMFRGISDLLAGLKDDPGEEAARK